MSVTPALSGMTDDVWDEYVGANPLATYLQTSAWAAVKAPNGWRSARVMAATPDGGLIGGQILLLRPRLVPWTFAYVPRGPLASSWRPDAVQTWTDALRSAARGGDWRRVSHVRMDPEVEFDGPLDPDGALRAALRAAGWRPVPEVQPQVTRVVDLTPAEHELWAGLRGKWRQYVNKARAGGVTVVDVEGDRLPDFHALMTETAARAGTHIRALSAYRDIWDAFRPSGSARLLFALGPSGDLQAALLLVRTGRRVVEPYGGMTSAGANSRANYLVKWEAIRTSRAAGAVSYDMWGLVHPGIRQFKAGFGGREI
ncbi:MAG TPA: peptidoglycan bridge formation glycyltransferase FemA/FemB family protein, partial [Candidatus Acidoferrum sp.]|nr:peptidoglycan bridge formation glycyltransferase FemA/FemB family protein [Candidatus Acidoferrum sp.]